MSDLELSILRQRSLEALKQKARRGELFLTVAVGYVKVRPNTVAQDASSSGSLSNSANSVFNLDGLGTMAVKQTGSAANQPRTGKRPTRSIGSYGGRCAFLPPYVGAAS